MDVIVHEIEVEGPANQIPEHLEVDVTALGVHEHVTAADIALPAGFKLLTPPETIVVAIEPSRTARELEEAAAGRRPRRSPSRKSSAPSRHRPRRNSQPGPTARRRSRQSGHRVRRNAPQRRLHGRRRGGAALRRHDVEEQGRRACRRSIRGARVVFVKPTSFMNLSGTPVRLISSWYRTPPRGRARGQRRHGPAVRKAAHAARAAATAATTACARSSRRSARIFRAFASASGGRSSTASITCSGRSARPSARASGDRRRGRRRRRALDRRGTSKRRCASSTVARYGHAPEPD